MPLPETMSIELRMSWALPVSILLYGLLAACGSGSRDPDAEITHAEYTQRLSEAGLGETTLGAAWVEAANVGLRQPVTVGMPHAEGGAFFPHEARAATFAFDAVEGQRLELSVARESGSTGHIFVDIFRAMDGGDRLEAVYEGRDPSNLELILESDAQYVVRLQPELLSTVIYRLRIELDAALAFPVQGRSDVAVQSFFGDPRDAGRRQHEGVDIFAPRGTPVLAVADGNARTRTNRLGGNTVWLHADDTRFYYAHLDYAAFDGRKTVVVGDVLGYVGNTGNARTTPPHLHFGMYRRFTGALNPLPYLRSRRLADLPDVALEAAYIETTASALHLRSGPRVVQHNVRGQLPAGTIARTLARSGDWLLVRTADAALGWISDRYQRALAAPIDALTVEHPLLMYSALDGPGAIPVGRIDARREWHVYARHPDGVLVGNGGRPVAWVKRRG